MTRRSRAREVALQLLFQFDSNPKVARPDLESFARDRIRDAVLEPYCLSLFDGVQRHRKEIDQSLTEAAENWRLHRMAGVDRNVLRIGAYELLFAPDVPVAAAINEAIELARRYGAKDSPSFVNGVLDRIARARPAGVLDNGLPAAAVPAEPSPELL